MVVGRVGFHSNFGAFKRNRHSKTLTRLAIIPFLYISSALIASIKSVQSGARGSLSYSLFTRLIPAYGLVEGKQLSK